MTGDRVEAAAKALSNEADGVDWAEVFTDEDREMCRITAQRVLAAADECDRVVGVVPVDTRDDATLKLIRRACNDPGQFLPRGVQYDGEPNTLGHWQALAVVAALAAAGAPEEGQQHD